MSQISQTRLSSSVAINSQNKLNIYSLWVPLENIRITNLNETFHVSMLWWMNKIVLLPVAVKAIWHSAN